MCILVKQPEPENKKFNKKNNKVEQKRTKFKKIK